MFSKELENLIQATLEDGVLEDNEKAALIKRAQREGVDLDELEIYISSLLQRQQRELNEKKNQHEEKLEKDKAKAIGPVCPKCGKQVPPLTLKCDCGYEFTKKNEVSSVQLLFERLNDIQLTKAEIDSCSEEITEKVGNSIKTVHDGDGNIAKKVDQSKLEDLKRKKKREIISTFPVPNTKEDIIEFLTLAAPNSVKKGGLFGNIIGRYSILFVVLVIAAIAFYFFSEKNSEATFLFCIAPGVILIFVGANKIDKDTLEWNKMASVWRAKFDQVLMKGRSLRGDPEFTQQLDYYENLLKMNEAESKKIFGIRLFG